MSHIANDIVTDNKLERMPWLFVETVERSDEMEQELAEVELDEFDAEEETFNDKTNY